MSKISIITVNLNDLEGLKKTVNSVLGQTFKDYEFIIIDGDSHDGSKAYITSVSSHLTSWISEPDRGIYNAMNKGISKATGTYLLFLNSGDSLISAATLQDVVGQMDHSIDIVYGDILYQQTDHGEVRTFPNELSFSFFYLENISHQASLIKRTLFAHVFLYNEAFKIVSDWEFFTCAICKYDASYQHLNLVITVYDASGISSNLDNHPVMHEERRRSLAKHFPAFVEDYKGIIELRSKRLKQFVLIKQSKLAYKILKGFMSIILVFLPKQKL